MLVFDPAAHAYTLRGVRVPSVTEIIREAGLLPDYPDRELYRKRGTAVHNACALLVKGRLDLNKTDPRLHGYVNSFKIWLDQTGFEPELIEFPVWSDSWMCAGTLDFYGQGPDGLPTILDLKSGEPASIGAPLQTAAYAALLKECTGKITTHRLALRLDPDGGQPKPEFYSNLAEDTRYFFSAASLYHLRKRHGLL